MAGRIQGADETKMKKPKRPRGLAARFKQLEIDEILLAERRAKLERQAMTKGKPIDDYAPRTRPQPVDDLEPDSRWRG
jgi:hypothetical protein